MRAGSPGTASASRRELRAAARRRRRYEKSEVRRFTRRARNRRRGWLVAGATVVVLGGLLAVAVYSPLLALREITVDGTAAVSAEEVRGAVDGQLGTPLALVDYDRIRAELDGFPLIRSYVTEVVPPGTLRIHVVERTPLGVVAAGAGYELVDPAGVVLSSAADRPPGLPLLEVGASGIEGVAFGAIVEVLLALPGDLRATVDSASAGSRDDVTLHLVSGQQVVWGSAERSALKARVLQELLAAQPSSAGGEYDVSAPLSPVVRSR